MTALRVQERGWDSFDGYLFDIDGTLVDCADAVHYFAFCDALQTLSGRSLTLEGVTAHGNTDVGILRDALVLAGVAEEMWRPKLPEVCEAMTRYVALHSDELRATSLPYVREMLEYLQQRGATLGIATGNLREIGRWKLRRAALLDYFTVAGWSDAYEYRADVFENALGEIRVATDSNATICVVGDTPADVFAARSIHLPIIAVATGAYSRQQLLVAAPDLCLDSFEELFQDSRRRRGC
jgi:phosphoglycolate phosphatase-like HAD superfamily hydrolase